MGETRDARGRATPEREITVRAASGEGRTTLSAFDHALLNAGVGDFNLITLSSVIPPGHRLRADVAPLAGGHGDRLYCVLSAAYADRPGETAWAGLGWAQEPDGAGLFVEHHAGSEESLREMIDLSLGDMSRHRGGRFSEIHSAVASAHYVDRPVCALVLAAYLVTPWE